MWFFYIIKKKSKSSVTMQSWYKSVHIYTYNTHGILLRRCSGTGKITAGWLCYSSAYGICRIFHFYFTAIWKAVLKKKDKKVKLKWHQKNKQKYYQCNSLAQLLTFSSSHFLNNFALGIRSVYPPSEHLRWTIYKSPWASVFHEAYKNSL